MQRSPRSSRRWCCCSARPPGTLAVFFGRRPWELEDAALIDGCARLQAVARVLLPLMAPAIVTVGLLTLILTWNESVIASVLSVESTVTVTVVIANFAPS